MKIVGLFIVVFGGLIISKSIGMSDMAMMVGSVIGAGTYLLAMIK